jgi:hypothetical protein
MYIPTPELRAEIAAIKAALPPSHPAHSIFRQATSLTSYRAALASLTKEERRTIAEMLKGSAPVGAGGFAIRC